MSVPPPGRPRSFIADLGHAEDVDERLQADPRPVFSVAGPVAVRKCHVTSAHGVKLASQILTDNVLCPWTTVRDIRQERDQIRYWCRAVGQINAIPVGGEGEARVGNDRGGGQGAELTPLECHDIACIWC